MQSKPPREVKTCKYEKNCDKTICSPLKYGSCRFSKIKWNQMGGKWGGGYYFQWGTASECFCMATIKYFFLFSQCAPNKPWEDQTVSIWTPEDQIGARWAEEGQGGQRWAKDHSGHC